MVDCYIALGGNLAGTLEAMRGIIAGLQGIQEVKALILSKLYSTTPVSPIPQPHYLNAVCRFQTDLKLNDLWELLKSLEKKMGKAEKPKENPRLIDLDLLFYGALKLDSEELTLPHPRWSERLFVLTPLADVTDCVPSGMRIQNIMRNFSNPHQEKVLLSHERWC